jgi:hypothetical protein
MNRTEQHLETLTEIRSLMERSSRFISLSGLSGVCAGVFALTGAGVAHLYMQEANLHSSGYGSIPGERYSDFYTFFFTDVFSVLTASLLAGYLFTSRKARQNGQSVWNSSARRLLVNLLIPLATGGLFCLILLYHGLIGLIAPSMLIFYGLALVHASKYTLHDIRYLGFAELLLGLLSAAYPGHGLIFWATGFGALHIVYGIVMYYRYER